MQAATKVSWVGQTFALARCSDAPLPKKSRNRRSKEERKTMVESFIKTYQNSNNGNFPSLNLTHKEVGGSFYIVREIVREIIQENKVLGPGNPNSQVLNLGDFAESLSSGNLNHSFLSLNELHNEERDEEAVRFSSEHQFYKEVVINPIIEESSSQCDHTAIQEIFESPSIDCASSELGEAIFTQDQESDNYCCRYIDENLLEDDTWAEDASVEDASQKHIQYIYQAVVNEQRHQEEKSKNPVGSEGNKNQDVVQASESISSASYVSFPKNNTNIISNCELVALTEVDDILEIADEDKSEMPITMKEIDNALNTLGNRVSSIDLSISLQNYEESEELTNYAGGPATNNLLEEPIGELMESNSISGEKDLVGNAVPSVKYDLNHAPTSDTCRPVDEIANHKVGLNLASYHVETLKTNVSIVTEPGQSHDINVKSESEAKDELKNSLRHTESSNNSIEGLNRKSLQDALKNGETAEINPIVSAIKGLFAALVKFFTE